MIVSGPPGVGKTTLAEMLCYAYLTENWELVAIRSLDDGFARIDDTKRQVFFFDDFLGRIALDVRALSNQDSDLAQFINRIRRTPSARFILTTRAYIYEEARLLSEALSATKLKVANYVLDVGIYTRRIRARILYNHLIVAGVSEAHIQALIESGAIKKIVDHKHYNPRIVQALTEFERVEDIAAADYPKEFLRALNDPHSVWDKAFRTHIAKRCQHLLFAMFVSADHGAEIEDVEEVFGDLHQTLCREFSLPFGPKDFEEALRTLEGSFLVIANGRVSYINPSVRDYLAGYMNDKTLLRAMAPGMATLQAARALFDHFRKIHGTTAQDKASFLKGYVALAPRAETERCWKPIASEPGRSRWHGLACSARIELLVSWWRLSKADAFLRSALNIATGGAGSFGAWEDGRTLPALLADLLKASRNERAATAELIAALEERLVAMLQSDLDPDDIKRIRERIIARQGDLPPALAEEVEKAIHRTIENLPDNLGHIESESTLDDYTKVVAELGASVGADPLLIQRANAAITSRTDQLREGTPEEDNDLSVTGDTPVDVDRFDDDDLKNLFAPLLAEPL